MNWYHRHKSLIEIEKIFAVILKDKYSRWAAELRDVLLQSWNHFTKEQIGEVIRALSKPGEFTPEDLTALVNTIGQTLGTNFANQVASPLFEIHTDTYLQGMKDIIKIQPSFQVIDNQALDMLNRHHIFWVKNYFDVQLSERVQKLGKQIIADGLSREEGAALFDAAFGETYGTQGMRYWRGFSNHVVTRSREMGRVEGFVRSGVTKYVIKAVIDRRTSPVCRLMNGQVFEVKDAVKLRDKLIKMEKPEEVKKIAPWYSEKEVEKFKEKGKFPPGMKLPPYHFDCRTRTVIHQE